MNRDKIINKISRVIIKKGSKALAREDKISYDRIKTLANDIHHLRKSMI